MDVIDVPVRRPLHLGFRMTALFVAVVLGVFSTWLLLAEFSRPGIDRLPTDAQSAAIAARERNDATWAALIGAVRGDLWAQSAFTFADLLWADPAKGSGLAQPLDAARARLEGAAIYGPDQAGAWLLYAGLASRYHWSKPNPAEALRMSYYTGPGKRSLMPLRSLVAGELPALDEELQEFVRHDLRALIVQNNKPAVLQAYQAATPSNQQFIVQAVNDVDPTFAGTLHPPTPQ
jgi:hypothetical protein